MIRFILMLFLSLTMRLTCASVDAQLVPSQLALGETFRLTITQDTVPPATPNIAPLQKDFNIVGTEQSMQYTMINGQTQSLHRWIIVLSPKSVGHFTIPALHVGLLQTQSFEIDVRANQPSDVQPLPQVNSAHALAHGKPVYLEGQVHPESGYVHQQIEYTVRLHSRQQLLDAQYSPPKILDALMLPMGEVVHTQAIENGAVYDIETQRYLIFPQKSGVLTINPPTLEAIVYDNPPHKVMLEAKPTTIHVQAMPYKTAHWLPSERVTLSENFANSATELPLGTTIARNISLTALGLPAQLLPELHFDKQKHAAVYAEKPIEKNPIIDGKLEGRAEYSVTYLFNEPGQVLVPEVKVFWFNTKTAQKEAVTLPARLYQIRATTASSTAVDPSQPGQHLPVSQEASVARVSHHAWFSIIIGGLGLALVIIVGLYCVGGRLAAYFKKRVAYRKSLQVLCEACRHHHALRARDALLDFAKLYWTDAPILQIQEISARVDDKSLQKALHQLSEVLYGQDMLHWNGDALWQGIQALVSPHRRHVKSAADLPPINPS